MDSLNSFTNFHCRAMRSLRLADLLLLAVLCLVGSTWAGKLTKNQLAQLLEKHRQDSGKRGDDALKENVLGGNPCVDFPDHPFPCKTTFQCLPFRYICDKNYDCDDGSDEDSEMCTASKRPPIDEIKAFLEKQRKWIMPSLFPGRDINTVAHAIAVSPTLKQFQQYLQMSEKEMRNLIESMEAVLDNHEQHFDDLGMPRGSWEEVKYIFNNLMENGFGI